MFISILVVHSKNSSTASAAGLIVSKSQRQSDSSDALGAVYCYYHRTIHKHFPYANLL